MNIFNRLIPRIKGIHDETKNNFAIELEIKEFEGTA